MQQRNATIASLQERCAPARPRCSPWVRRACSSGRSRNRFRRRRNRPGINCGDADELWTDGSDPSVVELTMLDGVIALPNYEGDRKFG